MADVGDIGGLALAAGIGGGVEQTCSPSSEMGTGWWHVEHLTAGSIWDILGSAPGGLSVWAIGKNCPANSVLEGVECEYHDQRWNSGSEEQKSVA